MNHILNEINSYLLFGYSLNYTNSDYKLDLSKINTSDYRNFSTNDLIEIGKNKLEKSFSNLFEDNKDNVVPISGGVDSRLILGILSKFTEISSINTYTFGTPGSYDYDIGNSVAKDFGTKHRSFSLNDYNYKLEELIEISQRFDYQSPLFIHPPVWNLDQYYKNSIIWSGVNAGAVVGSFVLDIPFQSEIDAKRNFLNKGSFVKSIDLCDTDGDDLIEALGDLSISPDILSYNEQVFIKERSEKHLSKNVLIKGYKYKTPFINNSFMDFMFSQKKDYRINKNLYKRIAYISCPKFFKSKIEGNYGLRINSNKTLVYIKGKLVRLKSKLVNKYPSLSSMNLPMINYMNFDSSIRNRQDIKSIIYSNINDLKSRKIISHIDVEKIWKKHQDKEKNYSDALIALASLEIHLKAGKIF